MINSCFDNRHLGKNPVSEFVYLSPININGLIEYEDMIPSLEEYIIDAHIVK